MGTDCELVIDDDCVRSMKLRCGQF